MAFDFHLEFHVLDVSIKTKKLTELLNLENLLRNLAALQSTHCGTSP